MSLIDGRLQRSKDSRDGPIAFSQQTRNGLALCEQAKLVNDPTSTDSRVGENPPGALDGLPRVEAVHLVELGSYDVRPPSIGSAEHGILHLPASGNQNLPIRPLAQHGVLPQFCPTPFSGRNPCSRLASPSTYPLPAKGSGGTRGAGIFPGERRLPELANSLNLRHLIRGKTLSPERANCCVPAAGLPSRTHPDPKHD